MVRAFIVTLGGEGSQIYIGGECISVPVATIDATLDPTGCGDAYRSGLLYGLTNQLDWPTTGRIAALMGAIKIETKGPQNYKIDKSVFNQRFTQTFPDYAAPLA
jgi:adenosine kinase